MSIVLTPQQQVQEPQMTAAAQAVEVQRLHDQLAQNSRRSGGQKGHRPDPRDGGATDARNGNPLSFGLAHWPNTQMAAPPDLTIQRRRLVILRLVAAKPARTSVPVLLR
jgi:hypothetical protein